MARFERHGSELAARPDVAWGPTADPPRIVRHSPPGGTEAGGAARPSLPVSSGPVAVDAPLRENHADPRVHCALS